ncbi:hypothetical protein AB1Y20_008430 [Prymnesium parvum]|uniref:CCHC-type domain-containing protein n=1 Tax=Prymnesium parvum TaxID=97485 RepID=A0AB34IT35_PRYPA
MWRVVRRPLAPLLLDPPKVTATRRLLLASIHASTRRVLSLEDRAVGLHVQRLGMCTRNDKPMLSYTTNPFSPLEPPRWDEPALEQYVLHEWPAVGDAFPFQRWFRRLRRDLELRFNKRPQLDKKWFRRNGEKILILIGHLGKEGKLDTPALRPLREAALHLLVERELLPESSRPSKTLRQAPAEACFNCGVVGHWKLECPEPPRVGRDVSENLSASEEARMQRRLLRVASAASRTPRRQAVDSKVNSAKEGWTAGWREHWRMGGDEGWEKGGDRDGQTGWETDGTDKDWTPGREMAWNAGRAEDWTKSKDKDWRMGRDEGWEKGSHGSWNTGAHRVDDWKTGWEEGLKTSTKERGTDRAWMVRDEDWEKGSDESWNTGTHRVDDWMTGWEVGRKTSAKERGTDRASYPKGRQRSEGLPEWRGADAQGAPPRQSGRRMINLPPALEERRRQREPTKRKVWTYQREIGDETPVADVNAVNKLVQRRNELRALGRWEEADAIRSQLQQEHNVSIYDQSGTWFAGLGSPTGERDRQWRS